MDNNKQNLFFFILSILIIIIIEKIGYYFIDKAYYPQILSILILRTLDITILLILSYFFHPYLLNYFSKNKLINGLKWGAFISISFAIVTGLSGLTFFIITGKNPALLIKMSIPKAPLSLTLFFITGVLVSPIAEEIFFRGVIYKSLRRYGMVTALLISSALFALCHFNGNNIPDRKSVV